MQCRCLYIDIFNNDDTRERENDQYWALAAPVSWDVPITARFLNAVKFFSRGSYFRVFCKEIRTYRFKQFFTLKVRQKVQVLLDVNIYFALHHFLILFGSFDRNKKRYTGEYVLAGLMYYLNCFH